MLGIVDISHRDGEATYPPKTQETPRETTDTKMTTFMKEAYAGMPASLAAKTKGAVPSRYLFWALRRRSSVDETNMQTSVRPRT
jgi:hypothetical protein